MSETGNTLNDNQGNNHQAVNRPLKEGDVPAQAFEYLQQLDPPKRMMIAKGLAPLKPAQLFLFTYMLIADPDEGVADAARENFAKLPPGIVTPVVSGNISSKILDYAANVWSRNEHYQDVVNAIALNRNTGEYTFEHLIKFGHSGVVDIIASNQEMLGKYSALIYAFAENPNTSVATVSRVLEFARRQHLIAAKEEKQIIDRLVGVKSAKSDDAPKDPDAPTLPTGENGEPLFPEYLMEEKEQQSIKEVVEERQKEEAGELKSAKELEQEIEEKLDLRETIKRMTVSEKLRLALRGNMEARGILVFDAVPIIAKNVINSPRVTKTEVERWSALKMLDVEILLEIAKNKEHIKSYTTRYNLVVNPKTPISIASKMMATLMEKDIKQISKSKAVPAAIANIARAKLGAATARRGR